MPKPKKGYKQTPAHRRNIGIAMEGKNNPMYGKTRTLKTKGKIRKATKGKKKGPQTPGHIEKRSKAMIKYFEDHPGAVAKSERNGFGIKCYSDDGLFFPSSEERDCYYWLRDVLKVRAKKFGRFDFIINGSVVLEYHPCNWFREKRTKEQYYKDRRKLLDEADHKDLELVVMISLSGKEKERVKDFAKGDKKECQMIGSHI